MVAAVTGFPTRSRRRPHGCPAASRRYERRRPEKTLTKIFLTEIERLLLTASGGTPDGGISFLHRFGSALNHHVHLHACVTDGVFVPAAAEATCDTPPAFLPARPITHVHLATLTERVRRRVIRWFRRSRLLDATAAADMLAWQNSGFSVDASVRITLVDRDVPSYFRSLEHLLRYCARPPFRARATLRDPRLSRPHHPSPLRAAPTQSRQLGRARAWAQVHTAGSQWCRRTHAV